MKNIIVKFGFQLRKNNNTRDMRVVILITTLLFILLHFPAYFIKLLRFGTFDFIGIIGQSISSLVWGMVLCRLLKKGKTLWNPIVAHTIYDLMYVLLVGRV